MEHGSRPAALDLEALDDFVECVSCREQDACVLESLGGAMALDLEALEGLLEWVSCRDHVALALVPRWNTAALEWAALENLLLTGMLLVVSARDQQL